MPVVRYLIEERGFDVKLRGLENRTPLQAACRGGHLDVVKYLIGESKMAEDQYYGKTPLHLAAEYGTLEDVQYMVDERNF